MSKDQFCPLAIMREIVENYSYRLFPCWQRTAHRGMWNQKYRKNWQQISAQSVSFLENYKYEKRN